MSKFEIRIESGYCPEFARERNVEVQLLIEESLNGIIFSPTLGKIRCSSESFCQFVLKHNFCPLREKIAAKYD